MAEMKTVNYAQLSASRRFVGAHNSNNLFSVNRGNYVFSIIFALGVLIFVFLVIFYGIIILHDIPYLIAKKRNHPHSDAISRRGVGQPVYAARNMAIFMDLGHSLSAGARLGNAA